MYEWFDKANLSSPNLLKKMSFGELHLESHWTKMELFGITNQVRQWSNDDWRIESPFIQGMNWWTYINEKPPTNKKQVMEMVVFHFQKYPPELVTWFSRILEALTYFCSRFGLKKYLTKVVTPQPILPLHITAQPGSPDSKKLPASPLEIQPCMRLGVIFSMRKPHG